MSGLAALAVPAIEYPNRWQWEQRFRESGLSTRAIVTGLAMATYASANGTSIRPSLERLAANTGQSRSTVDRAIRELKRWGWVETVRQGGHGGRDGARATEYRLTIGRARTTRGQLAKLREQFSRKGGDDVVVLSQSAHGLPVGSVLVGGPTDHNVTGDVVRQGDEDSHHVTGDVVKEAVTTSDRAVTTSSEGVTTSSETGHHVTGDVLPVQGPEHLPLQRPEQESNDAAEDEDSDGLDGDDVEWLREHSGVWDVAPPKDDPWNSPEVQEAEAGQQERWAKAAQERANAEAKASAEPKPDPWAEAEVLERLEQAAQERGEAESDALGLGT